MKVINLIENTEGTEGCVCAHGLSFYIETASHKLLSDLGPSEETLQNAKKLRIDPAAVDTVILSHGHYDHSGGILPFTQLNDQAKIYMQRSAVLDYYADDGENAEGERYRYIGIDKRIAALSNVVFVDGDLRIDDELELFTVKNRKTEVPSTNRRLLVRKETGWEQDCFDHEHYLVIRDGKRRILVSGCAHNGILNIMEAYLEKYRETPDLVISGFHLMRKTDPTPEQRAEIEEIARKLKAYPTEFITCHCTGTEAYGIMKDIMGEQLHYVHTGEEIKAG